MRTAKTAFLAVAMTTMAFGHAATAATDAEIKERVVHASTYIDNGRQAWRTLLSAIDLCEGDTNRFERVLRSLVEESLANGNARMARSAMWKIGHFGTTNSLPFLYGCATNAVVGGEAMLAAVEISGITSNSIERLNGFLASDAVSKMTRADCCGEILRLPQVSSASEAERNALFSCIYSHACTDNENARLYDLEFIRIDPTFKYSKRRLAFLRSVYSLGLNDFQTHFVTNDINELVAYPESALGD